MNIGLVTPFYPDNNTSNSGLANHFFVLAEALSRKGHLVTVVHVREKYKSEDLKIDTYTHNNIKVIILKVAFPNLLNFLVRSRPMIKDLYIRTSSIIKVFIQLNTIIKKEKLEVIETTSFFSLCYLFTVINRSFPLVTRVSTTYDQIVTDHHKFKSKLLELIAILEIRMIKKSKNLISHSQGHVQELKRLYNIREDAFAIIPHGVKLPLISKEKKTQVITILFVGRFEHRKGIDLLLKAIPKVLQKYDQVIFKLAGSGYEEYKSNFYGLHPGISDSKVQFLGNVSNELLTELYESCSIFIAPSRYESFGLIYIEAMSYAKPIIGCKVGGVIDVIYENQTGLFVEMDPSSIVQKLSILIEDEPLRKRLGINARSCVENLYSDTVLAEKSVSYYKKIALKSSK